MIGLELVYDRKRRIALEVVQLIPDEALAKTHAIIGQDIFRNVVQELIEYAIERHVVNELGCVLLIHCIGDIYEHRIVPGFVEGLKQHLRSGCLRARDDAVVRMAALSAKLGGGELVEGHVGYRIVWLVHHECGDAHALLTFE